MPCQHELPANMSCRECDRAHEIRLIEFDIAKARLITKEELPLRDQFAMAALNATRSIYSTWPVPNEFSDYTNLMAKNAYEIADAMLAEREKY